MQGTDGSARSSSRWWGIPAADLDVLDQTPERYFARRLAWAGGASAGVLAGAGLAWLGVSSAAMLLLLGIFIMFTNYQQLMILRGITGDDDPSMPVLRKVPFDNS